MTEFLADFMNKHNGRLLDVYKEAKIPICQILKDSCLDLEDCGSEYASIRNTADQLVLISMW